MCTCPAAAPPQPLAIIVNVLGTSDPRWCSIELYVERFCWHADMSGEEKISPALQQFMQEQTQKAQVTELTSHITSVRLQQCPLCYERALSTGSFLRYCVTCALSAMSSYKESNMQVCWDKCMGTPGRSLSSREQACLSECARRFLDTTQVPHTRAKLVASSFERVCLPCPDFTRFL